MYQIQTQSLVLASFSYCWYMYIFSALKIKKCLVKSCSNVITNSVSSVTAVQEANHTRQQPSANRAADTEKKSAK